MLTRLAVRDFALFEAAAVELRGGLNVLTGETGAGKSLVVQALGICLGARADRAVVRHGAKRATVEALFEAEALGGRARALLDEAGIELEADDSLIIRRVITSEGRTRAFVGDTGVTLVFLKTLAQELVDIHGQHAQQGLLDEHRHTELFDAAVDLEDRRRAVSAARDILLEATRTLDAHRAALAATADERAALEERVRDIEALAPAPGEIVELESERQRARHHDRVKAALGAAESLLVEGDGAASERVGAVESLFADLAGVDPFFRRGAEELRDIHDRLDELARESESLRAASEIDAGRLEVVEARLDALRRLVRVYGGIDEALAFAQESAARLTELDAPGGTTALEATVSSAAATLEELGAELTRARRRAARRLERAVGVELQALGFPEAALGVRVEPRSSAADALERIGELGCETMRFRFAPNPGEGERALDTIASGGELARVMLAIRTALAGAGGAPVLVFDEVDAAIGGAVLDAVADRLESLAKTRQVLCVTHEARIAARGDLHLGVFKETRDGRTTTAVAPFDDDGRQAELARMLAGARPGAGALQHARELLER